MVKALVEAGSPLKGVKYPTATWRSMRSWADISNRYLSTEQFIHDSVKNKIKSSSIRLRLELR